MTNATTRTLDWLLDSDPAIRWQVERDLLGSPPETWRATRDRVAVEGFGAALLAEQDGDGQWAGGACFPAGWSRADSDGEPWIATTWVLKDLREWGVDAGTLGDTAGKLDANCRWEYEDMPFWGGEIDVCLNSYTLANGAWLGADVSRLVSWFPEHRLADGGWNCEAEEGDSVRSSFHSTLNAITGILAYEQAAGDDSMREARHSGEEYLLERRLMRRRSTGEPVGAFVTDLIYPTRHQYNLLAALDHFRAASTHDGTAPDPRLADAVAHLRTARRPDGTWGQGNTLPGQVWVEVDAPSGEPSKWLTLIATRVLDWWDGRASVE
ncbi:squalene cyclase [Agromyces archimandritae]|uniref:Squalene cyclase n=1 Tax=Agromyces archimandritae TaxID=2781962 RepID=A0A975FL24_9MICO|nr:squalene cyclase [Agromyces archimandritae]QTX04059.1 squalene cyclase [Agromyces archimandritae]